jgi:hypothetical protein
MSVFVMILVRLGPNKILIRSFIYPYNSPLVTISAVTLFSFFRTIQIKSSVINWLAPSVFAVYLIHENCFINKYLYKTVYDIGQSISNNYFLFYFLCFLALGVMLICIMIDKTRLIITRPIEKILGRIDWEQLSQSGKLCK